MRRQFRADFYGKFQVELITGQLPEALGGQRGGLSGVTAALERVPVGMFLSICAAGRC